MPGAVCQVPERKWGQKMEPDQGSRAAYKLVGKTDMKGSHTQTYDKFCTGEVPLL